MTDFNPQQREARELVPNVLTCPECGAPRRDGDFDPEGVCECKNGHQFWDTNAHEWQIIRRLQRAEAALATREEQDRERRLTKFIEVVRCCVGVPSRIEIRRRR